jgi:transposase
MYNCVILKYETYSVAYPVELRERAITVYRTSKLSQEKVCDLFSICTTALKQWLRRDESGESLEPLSRNAGRPGKISSGGLETIKASIEANASLTLAELSEIY